MVKVKVEVTQKDIKNGIPQDCGYCPIALAVNRTFPKLNKIYVDSAEAYAEMDERIVVVSKTSKSCRKFIEKFDEFDELACEFQKKVKPFSFVIKLTNDMAKLLNPAKKYIVKE